MTFFQRKSARAVWLDYGSDSWFFITICSTNRQCLFGKIEEGEFCPYSLGKIIESEWEKSLQIREDLVFGNFQLMPNHLHGLIKIDRQVLTERPTYISRFINGFKSSCTHQARLAGESPILWQRGFHEHAVRNQDEWNKIDAYITNNPKLWAKDRFFIANG